MKKIFKEENLIFEKFNSKIALKIGKEFTNFIIDNNLPVAINIYAFGKTLYHFSNDNANPDKENWIRKKRNVVLHFHSSSKHINEKISGNQMILIEKYGLDANDFKAIAGSFPINLKENGTIGAITISGLDPDEDHNLIITILKKHL